MTRLIVAGGLTRSPSLTGLKDAQIPKRSAAMYGMMAALPDKGDLKEIVLDLLEQFTQVEEKAETR